MSAVMIPFSSSYMCAKRFVSVVHSCRIHTEPLILQNWISTIKENSKCLNYRIFKNDLVFEKYLSSLDPLHHFALCKFRCANAKLPAHTSRFTSGSTNHSTSPTCTLCDLITMVMSFTIYSSVLSLPKKE